VSTPDLSSKLSVFIKRWRSFVQNHGASFLILFSIIQITSTYIWTDWSKTLVADAVYLAGSSAAHLAILIILAAGPLRKNDKTDAMTSPQKFGVMVWIMSTIASYLSVFAYVYDQCKLVGADINHGDTFYFSVVTWTTLGYGDLTPSKDCRPWAATEAMLGSWTMALIVAALVTVIRYRSPNGFVPAIPLTRPVEDGHAPVVGRLISPAATDPALPPAPASIASVDTTPVSSSPP
jgi:hypothetical protein